MLSDKLRQRNFKLHLNHHWLSTSQIYTENPFFHFVIPSRKRLSLHLYFPSKVLLACASFPANFSTLTCCSQVIYLVWPKPFILYVFMLIPWMLIKVNKTFRKHVWLLTRVTSPTPLYTFNDPTSCNGEKGQVYSLLRKDRSNKNGTKRKTSKTSSIFPCTPP